MLSNVKNQILFKKDGAEKIYKACCPDGKFSFSSLIPTPFPQYAQGDDKPGEMSNWVEWNINHWGTKYPAFDQAIGLDDSRAYISFDTKHNVAYPVLAKFAEKFKEPFEHRYIHEGFLFWGVEKWGTTVQTGTMLFRLEIHRDYINDKRRLCIGLLGYDPIPKEGDT